MWTATYLQSHFQVRPDKQPCALQCSSLTKSRLLAVRATMSELSSAARFKHNSAKQEVQVASLLWHAQCRQASRCGKGRGMSAQHQQLQEWYFKGLFLLLWKLSTHVSTKMIKISFKKINNCDRNEISRSHCCERSQTSFWQSVADIDQSHSATQAL